MRVALVLSSLLLLPLSLSAAEKLKVVTSFSILADMAQHVGGDHIQVINLVGPDQDAQAYKPTGEDTKKLAQANVIIQNGLGYEPWMDALITRSGVKTLVITASSGITPRTAKENGKTVIDPHAWQSVPDAELYVNNIVLAFSAVDPTHANSYISGGKAYTKQLHALINDAHVKIGLIPTGTLAPGSRRFVTAHNSFGYLSPSYQIEFIAPQGVSANVETTPEQLDALIAKIHDDKAKAVLLDNTQDPRQLQQIAEKSGLPVRGTLYSDALSAKGQASTFIGMYQANIDTLRDALAQP
ncbi:zinc ABC transporter substrate-binding protein [Pseudomonas sp. CCI1.2]|uniref:metal ABC transporter solute-binding protein, Zn/Mn family n=1 Tax=unclassified Pseudomonas TaxID=196821 RepID=UPI002AC8AB06|nr:MULTISPECIES: zinc ABC transporter substrate-binding protein [unclassified Pseudomonas]MEB0094434.1 zinc ABC transporter substrate-binding protein [Pseudomonas sp. CCI4.2]MEB0122901.1 zinc ABC transporter substrate-binding protein [Pseudomonas sp. CCI1.2]WPX55216.1 zinc ABC transporter substrate-binding protein [Pseudomonas sp. CCI4.2]